MQQSRRPLICLLLALAVTACGNEEIEPRTPSTAGSTTVAVRVLYTKLLREGVLALYPEGRAILNVSHLGGGTVWLGTWIEAGKRLTVELQRRQEMMSAYSAPEELDPPAVIVLVRSESRTWIEERRTVVPFDERKLRWTFQGSQRVAKTRVESDFHLLTKEEFDARGGWELAPEDEGD